MRVRRTRSFLGVTSVANLPRMSLCRPSGTRAHSGYAPHACRNMS